MYIKQLTVHGFKSYRDETVFGPFSPHHNVIVGRNGSGKSNFFAAIRFVLHDAYTRLGQEERQALLHEGGNVHLSAYVEIVFDNSEGRFPTGKDTTTLRRTVGLKKDEYVLDGRPATKTDVLNLLQAAGFSKSNPYYIVPQGRVAALTNAKDNERLALLKEVAGTRTYEEHRQESLKILEETSTKRSKIRELLEFIGERMKELDAERQELTEFTTRDRERRMVEYVLQHRELVQVGEELGQLESDNAHIMEENETTIAAFDELLGQINTLESQLNDLKVQLREAEEETKLEEERQGVLLREETQLVLRIKEAQEKNIHFQVLEESLKEKLTKVEADIQYKEDALATLIPQLKAADKDQEERVGQLARDETRRETLQTKQGRSVQFRSAAERDRFLNKEIKLLQDTLSTHEKHAHNLRDEIESANAKKSDAVQQVEVLKTAHENFTENLNLIDDRIHEVRLQRDQLTEKKKELWRVEHKLDASLETMREELNRCERALLGSMDKGTLQGLESVRRISQQLGLTGVFGAVYELIEVDEVYRVAVEAIAGPSLFHVIVENDIVASRLLETMVREKSGRVTLIPLNRINPPPLPTIPSEDNNVVPLLTQIKFDQQYEPAMRQIFGKAVLCRDLESGSSIARQLSLTAITLQGDRADRKGALSGGYIARSGGRLDQAAKQLHWKSKVTEHTSLLSQVRSNLSNIETQLIKILAEYEGVVYQKESLLSQHASATELELRQRELSALEELIILKNKALKESESEMNKLAIQMQELQQEIGTPLTSNLSNEEQKEYLQLLERIESIRKESSIASQKLVQMSSQATSWENELDLGLRRQRHELQLELGRISTHALQRELEISQGELAQLRHNLEDINRALGDHQGSIKSLTIEIQNVQSLIDRTHSQCDEAMKGQNIRNSSTEKYLTRRNTLTERRDALQRKIRELAITPEAPLYEEIRDRPATVLMKRLHKLNDELRSKYAHVNKRAHDQHASFYQQGVTLRERQSELESSAQSIEDFIQLLDRRKDEAIDRTFQQVSKSFSEVFELLVPAGHAELVMIRGTAVEGELEGSDMMQTDQSEPSFDFTGISIRVSFNSKKDEGLLMSQLSGGQKSLVALALIFAIQRSDPAPFYLFDEIDAALDPAYRSAVARILANTPNAQFLVTTFRPELLETAENFFGVSFGGRVSRVECISREQALQFVEHEPLTN